ncbi:WD40 repeat domain-containing protein [Actinomadura sp. HBU206391]|uniref:WD40 repeat domain-containing protein n=1 Tax=Actinomadura sp. HBU206391 TaxID=2731692 RepID=UPI0016503851|nr:WD40 repeat domain-containing protein [Actinomadura sp. HBU206391]MBC6458959.1 WD40 repeat domain-containing protein [Actinomadura sp. HBU206391]
MSISAGCTGQVPEQTDSPRDITIDSPRDITAGLPGFTQVHSMAFSPDGKTLASGGEGGNVWLWDVASQRNTVKLIMPKRSRTSLVVHSVAFSPDGKILASGGYADNSKGAVRSSGEVRLWDLSRHRSISTLALPDRRGSWTDFESVAFSPDGKTVAAGGEQHTCCADGSRAYGKIWLWDVSSRRNTGAFTIPSSSLTRLSRVNSVAFSPDGKILATAGFVSTEGGEVRLWNVASRRSVLILRTRLGEFDSVAFSPDGKTLAIGGDADSGPGAGAVRLWDVAGHRHTATLPIPESTFDRVTFSPDGKTLASADTGYVRLWDVTGRRRVAMISGPKPGYTRFDGSVRSATFSPDGKTLAIGGFGIGLWHRR